MLAVPLDPDANITACAFFGFEPLKKRDIC